MQRPLSTGAQECYQALGRGVPRRLNQPRPPLEIPKSTVGTIKPVTAAPIAERTGAYNDVDFERHPMGGGPCPFGCCDG